MFSLQQPVLSNLFTFQTTALLLIYLQKSVHFTKLITWPSNKKVEVIPVCARLLGNHSIFATASVLLPSTFLLLGNFTIHDSNNPYNTDNLFMV